LAQDDYFYEIQLTNKQLVFYFMAGATGLVLSFLAGVMVGRGVDQTAAEVQAARPVQEEKIITEEPRAAASPAAGLGYAQRLEGDRSEERLERPKPGPAAAATPAPRVAQAAPPPATQPAARPAATRAEPVPAPAGGTFALQVGAFKDRATADSMVGRLKGKGFSAYVVTPQEGLFNVRVGSFATRPEAEAVQAKLREQKFEPFVVKN